MALFALSAPNEAFSQFGNDSLPNLSLEVNTVTEFSRLADKNVAKAAAQYWMWVKDNKSIRKYCAEILVKKYVDKKDYVAAKQVLEDILKSNPNSLELLEQQASVLLNLGDVEGSRAVYSKVYSRDPNNRSANIFLANYYFDKGSEAMKSKEGGVPATPRTAKKCKPVGASEDVMSEFYLPAYAHYLIVAKLLPSDLVKERLKYLNRVLTEHGLLD